MEVEPDAEPLDDTDGLDEVLPLSVESTFVIVCCTEAVLDTLEHDETDTDVVVELVTVREFPTVREAMALEAETHVDPETVEVALFKVVTEAVYVDDCEAVGDTDVVEVDVNKPVGLTVEQAEEDDVNDCTGDLLPLGEKLYFEELVSRDDTETLFDTELDDVGDFVAPPLGEVLGEVVEILVTVNTLDTDAAAVELGDAEIERLSNGDADVVIVIDADSHLLIVPVTLGDELELMQLLVDAVTDIEGLN